MTNRKGERDPDPVRVTHLRSSTGLFGAEGVIMSLIQAAPERDFEHRLCCLCDNREESRRFAGAAKEKGIHTEILECRGRLDPGLITRLSRYLVTTGTRILHCHEYKSDLYGLLAARLAGIKAVSTCHGWIGRTRALRVYKRIDMLVLRGMDFVVAVSDSVMEELAGHGIPGDRRSVIFNGIDPDRFSPGPDQGLRRDLGIDDGTIVIGTVGRLSEEKGHRVLLRALRGLEPEGEDICLVIVGDGPLRGELEGLSRELGLGERVRFAGQIREPSAFYRLFDIFVLPSFTEGLPLSVLEAMSTGIPVVASAVGGIPGIFSMAPVGRLVQPGNPGDLAEGLKPLLRDKGERERLGIQARQLAVNHFSVSKQVERYAAAYRNVLG